MKKKNKLDSILEPLFEKKEKLISSIEVSCNSIQFWEERAEKIFDEIDKTEEESFFTSEKDYLNEIIKNSKEVQILMKRISLENDQLDILEQNILDLEEELPFVGQSLLDDNSNSLAFSNWPGNYWGVMSESASYFRSSNNKDHIFGDPKELAYLKSLSSSLIDISKWSYQNNKHSKIEKKN